MKGVNKFAQILITERSKVDLKEVLGLSTFSIERSLEMDPSLADQMSDDEGEEVCTDETCTDDGHAHGKQCYRCSQKHRVDITPAPTHPGDDVLLCRHTQVERPILAHHREAEPRLGQVRGGRLHRG